MSLRSCPSLNEETHGWSLYYRRLFYGLLYRRIVCRIILSRWLKGRQRLAKFIALACHRLFLWPTAPNVPRQDLICLVSVRARGWILDAISREIVNHWSEAAEIVYQDTSLPPAQLPSSRTYFLSHYGLAKPGLIRWPQLFHRQVFVWYTHQRYIGMDNKELVFWLSQCTKVIATCSRFRDDLIAKGVAADKVTSILGGADPDLFTGHERAADGLVGFSTAYYERKDPDRILGIVKAMPYRRFLLLGRGWEAYPRFEELTGCENFEYVTASYENYPALCKRMTVFVSPARLEGGPIPLIETMMENVVPVASDTGFARDIIEHGRNGYIFPIDSEVDHICGLIDRAFENRRNIRETVKHLSWENFARQIDALRVPRGC